MTVMEDLPRVTRYSEFEALMASGKFGDDDQVQVTWVLEIRCDICGVIEKTRNARWEASGTTVPFPDADDGIGHQGTLVLDPDEKVWLSGDAEDYLNKHWDDEHPGVPRIFISDGQHGVRMARKGLVLP